MSKGDYPGEFEQVVLLSLAHVGEGAYGVNVRREIERRAGREVSIGSVYSALDRMEKKGYVSSWASDPKPVRGGRSRRYFKLEPAGVEALLRSRRMFDDMWADLDLEAWQRG